MLPLILLGLALVSALISRVLLVQAAFSLSIWWGLGVFAPFGPVVFRLCHPEEAQRARLFGLAALALGFFYVLSAPPIVSINRFGMPKAEKSGTAKAKGFTLPFKDHLFFGARPTPAPVATPAPTPTLQERWAANEHEMAQLREWKEQLRVQKRDLLHSDVEGNRRYEVEFASYNAAWAKALADRTALSAPK